MADEDSAIQIGRFADMVGLSIPSSVAMTGCGSWSRPAGRLSRVTATTASGRPARRILAGAGEAERRQILRDHRGRLEARLDEVRRLLAAVGAVTEQVDADHDARTDLSAWLHVMPRLPVSDLGRSIAYYEEALGFRLAWRTADGSLAALASGWIEMLLLVPWPERARPPAQSAYVYVEDPDALCAEYLEAGADVIDQVASRQYGMRDFTVQDPDGHRFTLGKGEDRLRDVAGCFGLSPDEIAVDPSWLRRRAQTE